MPDDDKDFSLDRDDRDPLWVDIVIYGGAAVAIFLMLAGFVCIVRGLIELLP